MVDFYDPSLLNLSVIGGGALAILAASRLITPYVSSFKYAPLIKRKNRHEKISSLSELLYQPVTDLSDLEEYVGLTLEAERIHIPTYLQKQLQKKGKSALDREIYKEAEFDPEPFLDYVVCFSNVSVKRSNSCSARHTATSLVKALRQQQNDIRVYAIGSDLIEVDIKTPENMLSIPAQSGFNFYHALEQLYSEKQPHFTYFFFLIDSNIFPSDENRRNNAAFDVVNYHQAASTCITVGEADQPYLDQFFSFANGLYARIHGDYDEIGGQLRHILSDSKEKMREVSY